jgi:hypothetical protein
MGVRRWDVATFAATLLGSALQPPSTDPVSECSGPPEPKIGIRVTSIDCIRAEPTRDPTSVMETWNSAKNPPIAALNPHKRDAVPRRHLLD